MAMPYIKPNVNDMLLFIEQTHTCEKLKVKREEIQTMMKLGAKAPKPNPYVMGHFDTLNYLFSLLGSPDFPCRDSRILTTYYKSEEALFWLRKMHETMSIPLAKAALMADWEDDIFVKSYQCGVLRNVPAMLAYSAAPLPEFIPKILHLWLIDMAQLHEKVKDNLENPYGISKETHFDMTKAAYNSNLLFCNLVPFIDGSNRLGRLVENLFRLNWRLKWKDVPIGKGYDEYIKDINSYQTDSMPKWLERTKELR